VSMKTHFVRIISRSSTVSRTQWVAVKIFEVLDFSLLLFPMAVGGGNVLITGSVLSLDFKPVIWDLPRTGYNGMPLKLNGWNSRELC